MDGDLKQFEQFLQVVAGGGCWGGGVCLRGHELGQSLVLGLYNNQIRFSLQQLSYWLSLIVNNMSEELQKPQSNSAQEKPTRERGKGNGNRDFKCPCGKSYLSYPALFTHIKQKHDGHAPGDIVRPQTSHNVRRGRPRLRPQQTTATAKPVDETSQVIAEVCHFLSSLQRNLNSNDLKHLFQGSQLYQSYVGLNPSPTSPSTCESSIVEFLECISQNPSSEPFLPHLFVMFTFFLSYFDSFHGMTGISRSTSSDKLITIVNDFILNFGETFQGRLPQTEEEFFKLLTMARVIEYLFKWMYKMKYSKSWVNISQSFIECL